MAFQLNLIRKEHPKWLMELEYKAPSGSTYYAERIVTKEPKGARGLPEFTQLREQIAGMANVAVPEWVPVVWK